MDATGDGVARLEGIAKPGAICISEDAYRQVKQRLDLRVSDLGQTQLKNIVEPIRVYSLEVGRPKQSATPSKARAFLRWPALAPALVVALVAAGAYAWHAGYAQRLLGASVAEDRLRTAPRFSIVVLPFENLSGDPEQQYFADGVTDDLTTDLSHIPDSFVIARDTAFTYKSRQVDAKVIGRDLGVRYASKAACPALMTRWRSTRSSSRPKPARMSGPTVSKAIAETLASCSSKSLLVSPIRSGSNS
jgi:hypothetical protein